MPSLPEIEEEAGIITEITEILSVEETEELWGERGKLVYVRLSGSKQVPEAFKSTRAVQKAVRSIGAINITIDTTKDLFDLDRESMQTAFDIADIKYSAKVDDEQYFNRIIPDIIKDRTEIGEVEIWNYEILVKV